MLQTFSRSSVSRVCYQTNHFVLALLRPIPGDLDDTAAFAHGPLHRLAAKNVTNLNSQKNKLPLILEQINYFSYLGLSVFGTLNYLARRYVMALIRCSSGSSVYPRSAEHGVMRTAFRTGHIFL